MSRLLRHRGCTVSVDRSRNGGLQSSVRPSSARGVVSPVMMVVLIIGIVAVLIIFGMYAMGAVVNQSYDNVDVTVRISGNDVVVTVIGGEDAGSVTGIRAYVDGTPRASLPGYQDCGTPGDLIIFPGLAKGTTGSAFVIVEATFNDGTTGVITYARLQFN